MNPADIRAFAGRAWDELEALREEHQSERFARSTPLQLAQKGRELRDHFRRIASAEAVAEYQADDLAHQIALKALLTRAEHVRGNR